MPDPKHNVLTGEPLVYAPVPKEGLQWQLCGRTVRCSDGLELLLPGGRWMPVRFELAWDTNGSRPVLYFTLGGAWERWTPPAGKKEGDEIEVVCECCQGRKRLLAGDTCYTCSGAGKLKGMVLTDREKVVDCTTCEGSGKVPADRDCYECWRSREEGSTGKRWSTIQAPYGAQPFIDGQAVREALLRWPRAARGRR